MTTSEKILTFSAIFISGLALCVSIFQAQLMQKQLDGSVWPRLSNGQGHGPNQFVYVVTNGGVGPAIISSIEYIWTGKPNIKP